VAPSGAALGRKQPGQAGSFEGCLCVVDRQTRKAEVLSHAPNGFMVDANAPEHFVLDLDKIVRVKKVARLKKLVGNLVGMEMKGAVSAQGVLLWIGSRGSQHALLLDIC
jgi:hypothetical protein